MTIDQRASRVGADEVPDLLALLAGVPTERGFERTVGDEAQALLADPEAVVEAIARVTGTGRWWVGVGIGAVEEPVPATVRAARGPALYLAREAVERAARETAGLALAVPESAAEAGTDAETALQALGHLLAERTDAGREAVATLARHRTQRAAAAELGISAQAVSERLALARPGDEARLRTLAVRLLRRAHAEV